MAKLYYRYGAMGSSKTANALMVKYNYEERGQKVLLAKPSIDTRDGKRVIKSRCGLESDCILFDEIKEETASNKMSSGSQILFIGNKSCNNSIIKPRIKPKIKANKIIIK